MFIKVSALLSVVLLVGCASVPESIQVADNAPLIDYQQASANPQQHIDKTVRWGGVIAKIENMTDQTMIEMVHYPLRSYGRPIISNQSFGRFRVYVDGFLDPMVFEQGRAVTFAGDLLGAEQGAVGEYNYVFPTVKSSGYHLWQDSERVEVSTISYWPHHALWGWSHRPYHQRVIIRNRSDRPSGGGRTPSTRPTNPPSRGSSSKTTSGTTGGNLNEY